MKPNSSLSRVSELQQQIGLLASVEPTDAAFLSCFLDLGQEKAEYRRFLEQRADSLRRTLSGVARTDFDQALGMIESRLDGDFHPEARGVALFARAQGGGRFFSDLQFAVPIANRLAVYPVPLVQPLLALKDEYDRYALVFVRRDAVQVIEVNLGAATTRGWVANPKSIRHNDGWLPDPAEADSGAISQVGLDGQVRVVKQLLQAVGRVSLFLAGDAELVAAVRASLRPAWAARLIDVLPMPRKQTLEDAVAHSLRLFVDHRRQQSCELAIRVARSERNRGLAVFGTSASLRALREGRVDRLALCDDYRPGPGWACDLCGETRTQGPPPQVCTACGRGGVHALDLRAELLRLAGQQGVAVGFAHSRELSALGGVACLLRPRTKRLVLPASQAHGRLALVA